jgi:hypothetical protein
MGWMGIPFSFGSKKRLQDLKGNFLAMNLWKDQDECDKILKLMLRKQSQ